MAITVNGDINISLGSEDPITQQILQDDGITPVDLTGISELTLYMRDLDTDAEKTLTGAGKVDVVAPATSGNVKISQLAADFPAAAKYKYKYKFKDSSGKQLIVPDGEKWYRFKVWPMT